MNGKFFNEVMNKGSDAHSIVDVTFGLRRFYRPTVDFRHHTMTKIANNY
jgi:hypothetical protein